MTFTRREFWFDDGSRPASGPRHRTSPHPRVALPVAVADADGATRHVWQLAVGSEGFHQLKGHKVRGRVVLPGAAIVDLVLAAARHGLGAAHAIEGLELLEPVELPSSGERDCNLPPPVATTRRSSWRRPTATRGVFTLVAA